MFLRKAVVFVGNVASFLRNVGSLQRKLVPLLVNILSFLSNRQAFPATGQALLRNKKPFLAHAPTLAANVRRVVALPRPERGDHAASSPQVGRGGPSRRRPDSRLCPVTIQLDSFSKHKPVTRYGMARPPTAKAG